MSKHSELAEEIMQVLYDANILETQYRAETTALIDQKLSGVQKAIEYFKYEYATKEETVPITTTQYNQLHDLWQSVKTEGAEQETDDE